MNEQSINKNCTSSWVKYFSQGNTNYVLTGASLVKPVTGPMVTFDTAASLRVHASPPSPPSSADSFAAQGKYVVEGTEPVRLCHCCFL